MKSFYLVVGILSAVMLLFNASVTYATPKHEALARELARYSDSWEIEGVPDRPGRSETDVKNLLIEFIKASGSPMMRGVEVVQAMLLVALGFCVIGFLRERRIEGKNA